MGVFQQGEHSPFQVNGSVGQRGPRSPELGWEGEAVVEEKGAEPRGPQQKSLHRSTGITEKQEPNKQQQLGN